MKCLLVLSVALLIVLSHGVKQRKCYSCRNCRAHRELRVVCKLESETRCLKFVGLDKNLDVNRTVTHKHCSPPSGCGYYEHNANYTVSTCDICEGNECNLAIQLEHSVAVVLLNLVLGIVGMMYRILAT